MSNMKAFDDVLLGYSGLPMCCARRLPFRSPSAPLRPYRGTLKRVLALCCEVGRLEHKARGLQTHAWRLFEALWKLRKTLFAIVSSLWDLLFASLVAGAVGCGLSEWQRGPLKTQAVCSVCLGTLKCGGEVHVLRCSPSSSPTASSYPMPRLGRFLYWTWCGLRWNTSFPGSLEAFQAAKKPWNRRQMDARHRVWPGLE